MKIYKTAEIAKIVGVHPNTIRFYEKMKLLPSIPRTDSGYRIFDDRHLVQLNLLRTAFRAEVVSGSLRQEVYEIVKTAASDNVHGAYQQTEDYLKHLKEERMRAEEAVRITLDLLEHNTTQCEDSECYGRSEIAKILGITADVLRDWERNGLILVPRDSRGYRKYGAKEMNRLKIIRTLRNANYSMMSILRMLNRLDKGDKNIREIIDTPGVEEDIVCAADRYITSLGLAEKDALEMLRILDYMGNK